MEALSGILKELHSSATNGVKMAPKAAKAQCNFGWAEKNTRSCVRDVCFGYMNRYIQYIVYIYTCFSNGSRFILYIAQTRTFWVPDDSRYPVSLDLWVTMKGCKEPLGTESRIYCLLCARIIACTPCIRSSTYAYNDLKKRAESLQCHFFQLERTWECFLGNWSK